jgi:hypothetical protein
MTKRSIPAVAVAAIEYGAAIDAVAITSAEWRAVPDEAVDAKRAADVISDAALARYTLAHDRLRALMRSKGLPAVSIGGRLYLDNQHAFHPDCEVEKVLISVVNLTVVTALVEEGDQMSPADPEPEATATEDEAEAEDEENDDDDFDLTCADARPVALAICQSALSGLRQAIEMRRAVSDLFEQRENNPRWVLQDDREWSKWLEAMICYEYNARDWLALCVLLSAGRVRYERDITKLKPGWSPVALGFRRTTVIVHPEDNEHPRPMVMLIESGDFDTIDFGVGADSNLVGGIWGDDESDFPLKGGCNADQA